MKTLTRCRGSTMLFVVALVLVCAVATVAFAGTQMKATCQVGPTYQVASGHWAYDAVQKTASAVAKTIADQPTKTTGTNDMAINDTPKKIVEDPVGQNNGTKTYTRDVAVPVEYLLATYNGRTVVDQQLTASRGASAYTATATTDRVALTCSHEGGRHVHCGLVVGPTTATGGVDTIRC